MAHRHAWLGVALLCACSPGPADYWQGYVEGDYVYVSATGAGTLMERPVARGARVRRGDPLFRLEQDRELAVRDRARARLEGALANLDDLGKGKRSEELRVVEARLAQARATLDLSEVQLRRQQALFAKKAVPRASLDEARMTLARDRGRVKEITADLSTARLAARGDAIRAGQAEVRAARADLDEAEWRLAENSRQAPEDALVVDTFYEPGEWVAAGRPVVALLPPGNLKLRFYVPEEALSSFTIGERLALACDGCPAGLEARISYLSPEAEYTPPVIYSRETRAKLVYRLEARPAGPYDLHPGQPIEVRRKPG